MVFKKNCRLVDYFPALAQDGFTAADQALMQIISLGITMGIAIVGGLFTGWKNFISVNICFNWYFLPFYNPVAADFAWIKDVGTHPFEM